MVKDTGLSEVRDAVETLPVNDQKIKKYKRSCIINDDGNSWDNKPEKVSEHHLRYQKSN